MGKPFHDGIVIRRRNGHRPAEKGSVRQRARAALLEVCRLEKRHTGHGVQPPVFFLQLLGRCRPKQHATDRILGHHAAKLIHVIIAAHDAEKLANLLLCGEGGEQSLHPVCFFVIQIKRF